MITDEPVRGSVPPLWFWALSGVERSEALSHGYVPAPPLSHLTGVRPAHVGPGFGTWTMPASEWLGSFMAGLEISVLVGTALHGIAMTAMPPGMTVDPVSIDTHHYRPTRAHAGNLLARGRVLNASQFFTSTEVQIEDTEGRQIASATGHAVVRQVEPPPPPPPETLRRVEEPSYATPDPHARTLPRAMSLGDMRAQHDWATLLRMSVEGKLESPSRHLLGFCLNEDDAGLPGATLAASEWLSFFSRSVEAGAVATVMNSVGTLCGLREQEPGESFSGLSQSIRFHRTIRADGRELVVKVREARRQGNNLIVGAWLLDAEGAVVADFQGFAALVEAAKRRKPTVTETKRELCTLVFTDIVGSTDHAKRLGDAAWRALLEQHHEFVRREIARCGGTEVDTAGDGFFVRFDAPASALDCARAVREKVRALGLEIRAGVHTGECEVQGRTLSGMAVHIASRIESAAAEGEVLVSSTVKDLVVGSHLTFDNRGEHELKGVPGPWMLYALAD